MKKGKTSTTAQIQDSKAVLITPTINAAISSPTMGMMGMLQNIAGRLMPL
jgi:hypothetical protein